MDRRTDWHRQSRARDENLKLETKKIYERKQQLFSCVIRASSMLLFWFTLFSRCLATLREGVSLALSECLSVWMYEKGKFWWREIDWKMDFWPSQLLPGVNTAPPTHILPCSPALLPLPTSGDYRLAMYPALLRDALSVYYDRVASNEIEKKNETRFRISMVETICPF